jgi:hypothetical protein
MIHKTKRVLAKIIRQLPSPFHRLAEEWKQSYLRRAVRDRYVSNTKTTKKPDPKVFGIGLSKTATSSLTVALRHLGYRTLHWTHGGQKILGWPEYFYADAATDTVCCAQFESLYHSFQESKFIYTIRNLSDWKNSIINHFGIEHPKEFRARWGKEDFWDNQSGWPAYNAMRRIQVHECLYAQYDTWEDAYQAYDSRVREFFNDKPDDRLLIMDITRGDGWDTLCRFLGHPSPNKAFPHVGKTRKDANAN